MGPVGFYEEFKDVYNFDPIFVEEYGHYYGDNCEDEDEEPWEPTEDFLDSVIY
jgi:hypothetical protein